MKKTTQLKLMTKVQLINEREDLYQNIANSRNRLSQISTSHPDVSMLTNNIRSYENQILAIEKLITIAK